MLAYCLYLRILWFSEGSKSRYKHVYEQLFHNNSVQMVLVFACLFSWSMSQEVDSITFECYHRNLKFYQ